jgi:spermidine synthase
VEHAAGDARLVLEREADQGFDVLVVDAFAGDAIPVHLLTREAFAVKPRHQAPGRVIAVQVTNRQLDQRPVARAAADGLGFAARWFHDPQPARDVVYSPSDWVILGADGAYLASLSGGREVERAVRWTDEATSLFPLLR